MTRRAEVYFVQTDMQMYQGAIPRLRWRVVGQDQAQMWREIVMPTRNECFLVMNFALEKQLGAGVRTVAVEVNGVGEIHLAPDVVQSYRAACSEEGLRR